MNLTLGAKWVRRNAFERARRLVSQSKTKSHLDRTLIIIDMQDNFLHRSEEKNLIPVISKLVQHAKQQKWAIILVEYDGQGSTVKAIIKTMKNYPHQATVIKQQNNGGEEIIECINKKKTWSLNLLVCGIYGSQCVSETVAGLFDYSDLVEVDVITDAICPPYCSLYEECKLIDGESENEYSQPPEKEITLEKIGITM